MRLSLFSLISLLIIFTCGITILFGACKKNSTSNTTRPIIRSDFSYNGNLVVDDTIYFYPTLPGTYQFSWDFGDREKSTEQYPTHVYKLDSTYVVTLIINNDSGNAKQKTLTISPPFGCEYTHLMGGIRNWHHYIYPYMDHCDTLNDTSFAVQVLNNMTIKACDSILHYYSMDFSGYGYESWLTFISVGVPTPNYASIDYGVKSNIIIFSIKKNWNLTESYINY